MEHGFEKPGNNSFWGLEKKLSSLLEPVTPDPEFVDSLKLKLTRTPAVLVETGRRQLGLLAVGIGMFTGAFIIWLLRRRSE